MGKALKVKFCFTHRSSPDWPYPAVYFIKGGRYIVGNFYSEDFAKVLEERLDNE